MCGQDSETKNAYVEEGEGERAEEVEVKGEKEREGRRGRRGKGRRGRVLQERRTGSGCGEAMKRPRRRRKISAGLICWRRLGRD